MALGVFDSAAESLERLTDFDRLEARGTLRLALKSAGLDAGSVSVAQLVVVLARVMPAELEARGIADADETCRAISAELRRIGPGREEPADDSSPEAIFRRLASR